MSKIEQNVASLPSPRIRSASERLKIWKKLQGSWKNRKTDPIKELEAIRQESDRTYYLRAKNNIPMKAGSL